VSKQLVPVKKLEVPKVPKTWDYKKSLEKVKATIYKIANITTEIANELFVAREKLSKTGRPKKSETKVPLLTWDRYCEELGVEKRTINRWLRLFFGKSELEAPEEEKAITAPEEEEDDRDERTIWLEEWFECFLREYVPSEGFATSSTIKDTNCEKCFRLTYCKDLAKVAENILSRRKELQDRVNKAKVEVEKEKVKVEKEKAKKVKEKVVKEKVVKEKAGKVKKVKKVKEKDGKGK